MSIPRRFAWLLLVVLAGPAFAAAPPGVLRDLHGDPLPRGAVARLGTVRWRHGEAIGQLVFSPDSRFVLGTSGKALHVWERTTGQRVRMIAYPALTEEAPFARFCLSGDGRTILSIDFDANRLIWWDATTGRRRTTLDGPRGRPFALALSPDGLQAAVAIVSSVNEGICRVFLAHRRVNGALRAISFPSEVPFALAFSIDGKTLTAYFPPSRSHPLVRRIDVASGRVTQTISLENEVTVVLSPSGEIAGLDREGLLWHMQPAGTKRALGSAPTLAGHELSFSPDGRTLIAFQKTVPQVRFYRTADGKERRLRLPVDLLPWASEPILSPDGQTLALCQSSTTVVLLDATTGKRLNEPPGLTRCPDVLAFTRDGRAVVTGSEQDGLVRWDAASGRRVLRVPATRTDALWRGTGVLTSDGNRLVRTRWRSIEVVDIRTGKILHDWRVAENAIGKLVLSSDDRTLASLGKDGVVRFWSLPWGRSLGEARGDKGSQNRGRWLQFSPDGQMLATGDGWFQVDLYQVPSGRPAGQMHQRRDYLGNPERFSAGGWQGAFAPDGRHFYSSFPHFVQVWDLAFRKELAPLDAEALAGASGFIAAQMALSADGRFLARVNSRGALSLWETASGRAIHRFEGRWGPVAFAPAGWRLAAADRTSLTVPIWDLPSLFDSPPPARTATLESLWSDLAHVGVARAQRAVWRGRRVEKVTAFLATKLAPVGPGDVKHLEALVASLGDDDFARREQAERDLADAGDSARDVLEAAARREKDLEIQFRLRRLLDALQGPSPRRLREMRAVLLLEANASVEARRLLQRLAGGLADATLTREARAALARLEKHSPLTAAAPAP